MNILKVCIFLLPFLIMSCSTFRSVKKAENESNLKPRVVILTDIAPTTIEPDDIESMVRLMAHADLLEIEAIITTSGWNSSGRLYPLDWKDSAMNVVSAYEKDLPNLMKRSGQTSFLPFEEECKVQRIGYWPSAEYLRSRIMIGSRDFGHNVLGKSNNSEGSEFIIKLADESDSRPLWIALWGGGNTIAQALWKIMNERTEQEVERFLDKIYIYAITDQDVSYGNRGKYRLSSHYWMRKTFGEKLKFIWDESAWLSYCSIGAGRWDEYATNIQNHGYLGKIYPKNKYGVEGDTPSFMHILPIGLNNPEILSQNGLGGYFLWQKTLDGETFCFTNSDNTTKTISKKYEKYFYSAAFNNFAARMDWAHEGKGNTNPNVVVNGEKGHSVIEKMVSAGKIIKLDASKSNDPENDSLTFKWWQLVEAGTFQKKIKIINADKDSVMLHIPDESAGKSIHIICEVTDNGIPKLTSYRRVVIYVKQKS